MTSAVSQRHACRVVGAHRGAMRYQHRLREDEAALRTRLRSLAAAKRGTTVAGGIDACTCCCSAKSCRSIIKRVYRVNRVNRLYRAERLAVRRRKRKRVAVPPRGAQQQSWKR
jgi:hypothetical protein